MLDQFVPLFAALETFCIAKSWVLVPPASWSSRTRAWKLAQCVVLRRGAVSLELENWPSGLSCDGTSAALSPKGCVHTDRTAALFFGFAKNVWFKTFITYYLCYDCYWFLSFDGDAPFNWFLFKIRYS